MKILYCVLLFLCLQLQISLSSIQVNQIMENAGQPLFVTPLINQGKINEARQFAQVTFRELENGIRSYSGFFTVDESYNSNIFFWFFPSQTNYASDPVILWLQGGPGASDLIGIFGLSGPFSIRGNQTLERRKITWTENHSVLYVDSPVGTGFSFTNPDGYSQNETAVGENVYKALLQFFQMFPELQQNDFFVSGESYGGKYVPAVSYAIYRHNPSASQKINLKGLTIGNGLIDPEYQQNYGPFLYQIGLIDANQKELVDEYERQTIRYIQNQQWVEAFRSFDNFINGAYNNATLFKNLTGFDYYYNYLTTTDPNNNFNYINNFIGQPRVRAAIHVGNIPFKDDNTVLNYLIPDVMQSIAPWLSELLNYYRVLIYTGQLDIILGYPLVVNFLDNFKFNGSNEYKTSPRRQWYVDNCLAGYVKQGGNLTEVMVRNAGHLVPQDQPLSAFNLITKFTRNQPLY